MKKRTIEITEKIKLSLVDILTDIIDYRINELDIYGKNIQKGLKHYKYKFEYGLCEHLFNRSFTKEGLYLRMLLSYLYKPIQEELEVYNMDKTYWLGSNSLSFLENYEFRIMVLLNLVEFIKSSSGEELDKIIHNYIYKGIID